MSNDEVFNVRVDRLTLSQFGDRVSFIMNNSLDFERYKYFMDIPFRLKAEELAVRLRGMAERIEEDIRLKKYEQQASEF